MQIVMVEPLPFDGAVQVGSHHYARHFMRSGHSVLWLSCPYHLGSVARGAIQDSVHTRAWHALKHGPQPIGDSSFALHPVVAIPFRDRPMLRNRLVMQHTLRTALPPLKAAVKRLGFASPELLWLSQSPLASAVQWLFEPERTFLRMSDRYGHFDVPRAAQDAERALVAGVDHIAATSEVIAQDVSPGSPGRVTVLPNGVDVERFQPRPNVLCPDDLSTIPHPRALFVGTLAHWIDPALLAAAAREANVVVIGPGEMLDPHAPNIHLLGPRSPEHVPAYMQHCDVGLLPFEKSPLTDAADPVKIYEYLAMGLPVVARRLQTIEAATAPVHLVDTPEEFATATRAAVRARGSDAERREYAHKNRWDTRFAQLDALLEI